MTMNVLLTGAFGRVGTAIIQHLADRPGYDFTYLDREPHPEHDAHVADIADYEAIRPAFDGQDAVVHLAGNPSTRASWEAVHRDNLVGTYNVVEAARDAGVRKVLFASTNHVVGMYQKERAGELDPSHELLVDHTDPVRPDSYYATTKLFGERLGRYYVERREAPEQFYGIRIGWVLGPGRDHPYGGAERDVDAGKLERGTEAYERRVESGKALWCSRRDMARFVDCALEDDTVEFDVFYARSGGSQQWLDIEHAREVLGYEPVDDADEWTEPPT